MCVCVFGGRWGGGRHISFCFTLNSVENAENESYLFAKPISHKYNLLVEEQPKKISFFLIGTFC